jgi:predicted phosphodiesterase
MVAGIWELVREVLNLGLAVKIWGVRGNHGRQGKYAPADNNFDYLVFQMLRLLAYYEAPAVGIKYATNTDYLNCEIKGRKIHLRHIAPPQAETAAGRAKWGGWQNIHDYEIACFGHLHHPGNMTWQGCELVMNGSPIGIDDLAERLAVRSRPSQTLFGVDPVIGQSFVYRVYLDCFGSGGEAEELLKRYPMLRTY